MASIARPRAPIGISDFRELRKPGVLYVDKTGFIVDVLEGQASVLLFLRPRRFGKTSNLSAFRYFVQRQADDHTALFSDLAVWRSEAAREHFGRYPVISLTFKDVKGGDFDRAFAAIQGEIRMAYGEHAYLLQTGALRDDQAARFRQILRGEGPEEIYAESLRELSSHLARHHGEQVVVVIDEYDTPIHSAESGEDERRLLAFFRAFFSAGLKDNPHIFKGMITGILRIAKESLFSGMNNLAVYSLLRPEHATAFGFTPEEVTDLAERTGAAASLPEMERWYDGYRFGGQVVYNPWSVVNFLDSEDKELRPYWVQTSSEDLLRRVLFMYGATARGELEVLLQGGEVEKRIQESVALRDLPGNPDVVWSFLLLSGYLKAARVRVVDGETLATLAVPNREVLVAYRTIFRSWLERGLGGQSQVEELLRAVLSGDAGACEELLGQLVHSLSVHDLGSARDPEGLSGDSALPPERVYHVFVVSLLLGLQPGYHVRSNRESGSGRYDVMILPREPGGPGVVIELKVRNRRKRESVKGAMAAALRQLRDRDYAAELRAAGASPIHEMGVVFDGKEVHVEVARPRKGGPARGRRG